MSSTIPLLIIDQDLINVECQYIELSFSQQQEQKQYIVTMLKCQQLMETKSKLCMVVGLIPPLSP